MQSLLECLHPLLVPTVTLFGNDVAWAEIAAASAGLAMVVCNLRVSPWGWPLAITSSLLYAALFAHSHLYGQASLQVFFVAISLWGWRQWLRPADDGKALEVGPMSRRQRLIAALLTGAAWPVLALGLATQTDSALPWLDALPTVASVTAQVLLARKRLETWPVWLAVNLVSMLLFALQGLALTVLLYAVFAAMSVAGWRAWSRRLASRPRTAGGLGR